MMKKSLLFVAAAVATLAGCSKSVEEEILEPQIPSGYKVVQLKATAETPATKVSFTDDKTFGWQAGDAIGVYAYGETSGKSFGKGTFAGTPGDASGSFDLVLPEDADYYKVAYYPYVEGKAVWADGEYPDERTLTVDFPAEIEKADPSVLRMPMAAYFTDDAKEELNFKNVGGLVKVTLKNVPAEAKYFKLIADKQLSGKMSLDATQLGEEGGVFVASETEGAKFVQYNLEGEAAAEQTFYFPVPTGSFKFGFEVYGDDLTIYQQELGETVNEIGRGVILRMPEIEIPATTTDYALIGYFEDNNWEKDIVAEPVAAHFGWVAFKGVKAGENGSLAFKLRRNGSWADADVLGASTDLLKITNVLIPLSHPGSDIKLVSAEKALDIYFNEEEELLFALFAGSDFVLPTETADDAYYHLIGSTAHTAWDNEYYPAERVEGKADWLVVKNVPVNADNNITFKVRNAQGSWADANVLGADAGEPDTITAGTPVSLAHPGKDIKVEAAAGTEFDVYINAKDNKLVVLLAGTDFDTAFPVTTDKGGLYATIQAAVDAAVDGEVITAGAGRYDEHVVIKEKSVTVQGVGEETIVTSFELFKAASTVKNLLIAPQGEYLPTVELDQIPGGYQYPFGVYINRPGFGAVIDNVVIDMADADANATALFSVMNQNNADDRGTVRDVVKNSTVKGVAGKRNAQLYSANILLENNRFIAGHVNYGVRVGNNGHVSDVILTGNNFESAAVAGSTVAVELQGGEGNTYSFSANKQDGSFKWLVSGPNEWVLANNHVTGLILGRANIGNASEYVQKSDGLATRAWGNYNSLGDWDDAITGRNEWDRSAVLTPTQILVAITGSNAGEFGVAVINRKSAQLEEIITDGFDYAGATFKTCGIVRNPDNGDIYVCNLARNGQTLRVFKLDLSNKKAEQVYEYVVPQGERYGDKMSLRTGWAVPVTLCFLDYTGGKYFELQYVKEKAAWTEVQSNAYVLVPGDDKKIMGSVVWTGEYNSAWGMYALLASNREVGLRVGYFSAGTMEGLYDDNGQSNNRVWHLSEKGFSESNMMDPCFFDYNGNKYIAYVSSTGTIGGKASGYLRIVQLSGSDVPERLQGLKTASVDQVFALGAEDDIYATGNVDTNQQGFCTVYNLDGTIYIAAALAECGMTLVQMN